MLLPRSDGQPRPSNASHGCWQLYEKVFHGLFGIVAAKVVGKKKFRFRKKRVSLDSTVIDLDRKSTRLNSSHIPLSRMPSSA